MLYFIITTSLYKSCNIRKQQYINAITQLTRVIKMYSIECKIIIVENNGSRSTFLDELGTVFYTRNNFLPTTNIGIKELKDVLDSIEHYGIQDTDFIVKMTGRYVIHDDSPFLRILQMIETHPYDAIVRFGWYNAPVQPVGHPPTDCVTGLIGMRSGFIKQIKCVGEGVCVEWKWAEVTSKIDSVKVGRIDQLGIDICPGSNKYFKI